MYNYKVYNKSNVYQYTINPSIIKNNASFSANINGWQWQFLLSLIGEIAISPGDILRVYRKTKLIYTGVFQNLRTSFSENGTVYEYPVLGLVSILSLVRFWDWNKNQDPATSAKEIIDALNLLYPFFSYTTGSIPLYGSSINLQFKSSHTYLDALKLCFDTMWRYMHIDQNGLVTIKQKWSVKDYSLTLGREIASLDIEENGENIKNNVTVKYSSSTHTETDATSISTYGQRDYFFEDLDMNLATATVYAQNFLANNKDKKVQIEIKVVRTENFDFDDVKIWDIVKINNTKDVLSLLQIVKYSYNEENMKIYFEDFSSFWKELLLFTQ